MLSGYEKANKQTKTMKKTWPNPFPKGMVKFPNNGNK